MSAISIQPERVALPKIQLPAWALVPAAALMLGLVFLTGEHRWDRSALKDYVESADERAVAATQGNRLRRIAFVALGGTGLLLLVTSGRLPSLRDPMGLVLLMSIGWTFASILWADSTSFTLKRLMLLTLCGSGVAGFASAVSLRQLAVVTLSITAFYLGMGVFAELSLSTFRPWAGGYRFAGTLHPNAQATNCGAMALAAFALWRDGAKKKHRSRFGMGRRHIGGVLFLVAVFFLVMTKSRTATAAIVLVIGMVWATRQSFGTNLIVAGIGLLAAIILGYGLMVSGAGTDVSESANMGRADSQGAFNGRLPIWEICIGRVGSQLPIGFGYDGFWTPDRIQDVSWELGWSISSAHSEYIEIALGLGIIGLLLYLTGMLLGMCWFWVRYMRLGHGGDAMVFGLLTIGAIQGFMETGYLHPNSLAPFVCLVGMTRLAFFTNHANMWKGTI